jgi:hypothetical protein
LQLLSGGATSKHRAVIAFVAKRSPLAADAHDRVVADAIVRSEAIKRTKAMVDGCELSAQSETRERVVEMLVAARKQDSEQPRPAESGSVTRPTRRRQEFCVFVAGEASP